MIIFVTRLNKSPTVLKPVLYTVVSSVLRGDIQNYCKFKLQSPDNMKIVNKLLYIDSYYLASMVIFSNVLKQLLGKKLFQNNFSPRIINPNPNPNR